MTTRSDEIAARLADVRRRIREAGGDDVLLVVVTKYFPASDVQILADLGVTDVGENRHQEALEKVEECAGLGVTDLRWHFIGALQSNKAAAVAGWADVVQSVDRAKLVGALARGADTAGRPLEVLVQVSLDPPGSGHRAGAAPADVAALADTIAGHDRLHLRGLMAVAPLGEEPGAAFDRLAGLHADLLARHPEATWLSAGMSGDLEQAVERGATHVRVGSAVLGPRPPVQ